MKFGLVCPFSLSYFGGVQKHVLALQREFKGLDINSKILAPRQKSKEYYGKDVLLLGYSLTVPANASRADFSWGNPFETNRVLRKERFDLLHFHGLSPFLDWQILESAKRQKIPCVFTIHTNPRKSTISQAIPLLPETYFNYIMSSAWGIICVSNIAAKSVEKFKGPKEIIPNGVDIEIFRSEGEKVVRFDDGKINVLFVGRLDERKGLMVLLSAWEGVLREAESARLLIVGEGSLEATARKLVKDRKLSGVHFLGAVSDEELPKYYRTAHIFCAPSLGGESFGMVLLEAMACSLPVVASSIEGYTEVLTGTGADLLFKANDETGLARILTDLIESPELRRKYSRWGQREAEKYSWQKVSRRVLEFYDRARNN
jgi:phosphatidylinositol alpha-mannosyltransferase